MVVGLSSAVGGAMVGALLTAFAGRRNDMTAEDRQADREWRGEVDRRLGGIESRIAGIEALVRYFVPGRHGGP